MEDKYGAHPFYTALNFESDVVEAASNKAALWAMKRMRRGCYEDLGFTEMEADVKDFIRKVTPKFY